MREVRTCDFCDDAATGAFEPYPPSMPDGPRLLLCDDCRDRLGSIVEPLVARIDDGAAATRERATTHSDPDPTPDRNEERPDRSTPEPADDGASTPEPSRPVGESTDASGRSTSERAGTPPNYRKVMRFLENRQFPVERDEAEHIVAEAYEIDEDTVAEAIDHAVSYGRLREVSGQLKR